VRGFAIKPLLWGLIVAANANAAPSQQAPAAAHVSGLVVDTSGQCPSRPAVMAALVPAMGRELPEMPGAEVPRVLDLGDRFLITAFGQTRQYLDSARDCAERARVAAVFIALALNPPALPPLPAAPPAQLRAVENAPPAPDPSRPPPGAVAPSTRWASVAVGARVDGAIGAPSQAGGLATGAELRGVIGWRFVGLAATAGILAPTEGKVASLTVHEQRFPLSLALGARRALTRGFEVAGALGVSLVPLTLRGDGLMTSRPATRVDIGARLAFELRLPPLAWRAAPFVGVHAEYFPRPYVLDVSPLGEIGSTNRFWLGLSLGVAVQTP
jgi:hypothetical protein